VIWKKKLKNDGFKKDVDYIIRKKVEPVNQGGTVTSNEYMLKPDVFKKILIRSTKCEKYADYNIYLEKCVKYYNEYQIELNKKYVIKLCDTSVVSQKDDKIDELIKKVDTLCIENKTKTKQIEKLLSGSKETYNKLYMIENRVSDVEGELIDTITGLETMMSNVSDIQSKLEVN